MITTLTVFYTNNLQGDLARLSRLYRFLQQLKQEHDASALVLDLGNACSESVWHCDATKGRSTVIVLDGMGYHAVNVSGYMTSAVRDGLQTNVSAGLVTERHMWRYHVPPVRDDDIVIAGQATPAMTLCIICAPAETTKLENRMLYLQATEQNQVGLCVVDIQTMTISQNDIITMPKGFKPDATIAASVELIEDEARLAQKRN
ncbi:MAG: hypothetical protein AAFV93_18965 [Chloroflexota bacterium]